MPIGRSERVASSDSSAAGTPRRSPSSHIASSTAMISRTRDSAGSGRAFCPRVEVAGQAVVPSERRRRLRPGRAPV
ncbi:hypothetical protein GCM10010191_67050 [Actinomadura vinacea]|uniref:Uncharacterized protein n=1 Tax=Actinomadura vinacea TaxID=115336 RepID=A0ABN3JVI1_9ACTN